MNKRATSTRPAVSYQELSQQLEDVLAALQSPDVAVDEAVRLYEQGLELATALEAHLREAQNTIERLKLQTESDDA